MTEAAHQMPRTHCTECAQTRFGWLRHGCEHRDSTRLAICCRRARQESGDQRTERLSGYEGNAEAMPLILDGWFRTGDQGYLITKAI